MSKHPELIGNTLVSTKTIEYGVMVNVVGIGHDDMSSNPGRD